MLHRGVNCQLTGEKNWTKHCEVGKTGVGYVRTLYELKGYTAFSEVMNMMDEVERYRKKQWRSVWR
jgi:hypothetical protein